MWALLGPTGQKPWLQQAVNEAFDLTSCPSKDPSPTHLPIADKLVEQLPLDTMLGILGASPHFLCCLLNLEPCSPRSPHTDSAFTSSQRPSLTTHLKQSQHSVAQDTILFCHNLTII